jgi:hypothetical protein
MERNCGFDAGIFHRWLIIIGEKSLSRFFDLRWVSDCQLPFANWSIQTQTVLDAS